MNYREAKKYSHLFEVSKDFEPHETLPEKTARARGFIEGYNQAEQEVRKQCAEIAMDYHECVDEDCTCPVKEEILSAKLGDK